MTVLDGFHFETPEKFNLPKDWVGAVDNMYNEPEDFLIKDNGVIELIKTRDYEYIPRNPILLAMLTEEGFSGFTEPYGSSDVSDGEYQLYFINSKLKAIKYYGSLIFKEVGFDISKIDELVDIY